MDRGKPLSRQALQNMLEVARNENRLKNEIKPTSENSFFSSTTAKVEVSPKGKQFGPSLTLPKTVPNPEVNPASAVALDNSKEASHPDAESSPPVYH